MARLWKWLQKAPEIEPATQALVQQMRVHLDFTMRVDSEIELIRKDLERLRSKGAMAAQNEQKAWDYLAQLEEIDSECQAQLANLAADSLAHRKLEVEICQLKLLWLEHSGKHHLYSRAAARIQRIVDMNEQFLNQLLFLKQHHLKPWCEAGLTLLQATLKLDKKAFNSIFDALPQPCHPIELLSDAGWAIPSPDRFEDLTTFSFASEGHTAPNT